MTEVKEQLRSARHAYRGACYPGDLANELLPQPVQRWGWFIGSGVGASIAAAVLLSLLLNRGPEVQQPVRPADRTLANWFTPRRVPLPHFEAPALPVRPPELRLPEVPRGVEAYQDLAMQYRELQLQETLRRTTVPTIPVDLPSRGVEWLHKVWSGDKSV
jgi:hypothetical protein